MPGGDDIQPERNIFIRAARKWYPPPSISRQQVLSCGSQRAFHDADVPRPDPRGHRDIMFAIDSIPAIFG